MSHLVPCPGCHRHVRVSEAECPFCAVPLDLGSTPAPALPTRRLGRSALFAFGATLAASLVATSCGGDSDGGSGGAGGTSSGGSGGATGGASSGGGGATGGASSGGSGGATGGAAGSDGGGGFAGVAPAYGLPADAGDEGQNVDDGGGAQPLYGAPPPP